jgi:hypothetical protein
MTRLRKLNNMKKKKYFTELLTHIVQMNYKSKKKMKKKSNNILTSIIHKYKIVPTKVI